MLHAVHTGAGCVIGVGGWAVVIFWLAANSRPNLAVPMAHLLDRLLMRQSVKDQGGARYIDDVRIKLNWCSASSSHRRYVKKRGLPGVRAGRRPLQTRVAQTGKWTRRKIVNGVKNVHDGWGASD